MRYRDEGRGNPLLLVHGWALALEMWQPQVEALTGAYRIVRMDRRGFGMSTGNPDLQADARDLEALLTHLGLERVAVLGMSQGARVALSLAGIAGDRTSCLILDGAPADPRVQLTGLQEEIPLQHYRTLLNSEGIDALRSELSALPLMRLHTTDIRMHHLVSEMLHRYRALDLDGQAPSTVRDPLSLDRLHLPILVLTGEFDSPQRQRIADAFCDALPNAKRATVSHAGHLANLDNPQDYNEILTDFLRLHAPASP